MKTKTTVSEITQEDLCDLLSTSTYGSEFFGCDIKDPEAYDAVRDECDSYEDVFAKVLLHGGAIIVNDCYAEDETDFYGTLPHEYDEDEGWMRYDVCLTDIKKGIEKALDNGGYDARCARHLIEAKGDLDLPEAENLMQIIVFGEAIYG